MGTFTYENQGINTILVYTLDADENMDALAVGMTANNKVEGILSPGFVQKNMARQLKYDISAKITLKKYLSGTIRKNQLIGIFRSLTEALMQAENYLLGEESFLLDQEHIYVNEGSLDAYLLCFPVEKKREGQVNYYEFVHRLLYEIKFDESEDCVYVASLMNYINKRDGFSFRGFLEVLERIGTEQTTMIPDRKPKELLKKTEKKQPEREIVQTKPAEYVTSTVQDVPFVQQAEGKKQRKEKQKKERGSRKLFQIPFGKKKKEEKPLKQTFAIPGQAQQQKMQVQAASSMTEQETSLLSQKELETTVLAGGEDSTTVLIQEAHRKRVTVTQLRSGKRMEIFKDSFCIGRSEKDADFYIPDNNTVGRVHATIFVTPQGAFIQDNKSLNHTYVNAQMLSPGMQLPLADGDRIRLSDEEFMVSVED